jgi:hypothetical protein
MKKKYLLSKTINKFQLTLISLAKGKIKETLPAHYPEIKTGFAGRSPHHHSQT